MCEKKALRNSCEYYALCFERASTYLQTWCVGGVMVLCDNCYYPCPYKDILHYTVSGEREGGRNRVIDIMSVVWWCDVDGVG